MPIPWTLKSHLDREHVHYDILSHSQTFLLLPSHRRSMYRSKRWPRS